MTEREDVTVDVVIVGGGVAGLNAGRRLTEAGIDVELFEARERLGGRVHSVDAEGTPSDDGFDLGPSWVWPDMQPVIGPFLDELDLSTYPQQGRGDVIFERMSREPAQRYTGGSEEPGSRRIEGGSAGIVRALAKRMPAESIRLGTSVRSLALTAGGIDVVVGGRDGERTVRARQVILAVPPRLAAETIPLSPSLPRDTAGLWRRTPTWMAPHAKFFALYERAFWLDAGFSGTAQSMVGPLLEIHDATTASGSAALFGFVGIGALERRTLREESITQASIAQFVRLFGQEAAVPTATLFQDWAADPLTATADDAVSSGHPTAGDWVDGPWLGRLHLAGSEVSPTEAGYLAGAVQASEIAAAEVRAALR